MSTDARRVFADEVSNNSDEPIEIEVSYEQERLENIKNNAALLDSLGLSSRPSVRPPRPSLPPAKKQKLSIAEERTRSALRTKSAAMKTRIEPTRRSGRVAALQSDDAIKQAILTHLSLRADMYMGRLEAGLRASPTPPPSRHNSIPKSSAPVIPAGPSYSPSDEEYSSAPRPGRQVDGTLVYEGRWKGVFSPNLTPEEMFKGGAFAGGFFCDTYSHVLRAPLPSQSDLSDLPFSLPADQTERLLSIPEPDGDLNRFRVRAGQSLQEWEKAGWIWAGDPRGWAQWYVRFWAGRRCEDDERQVRRWLKVAGPTGRFKRALLKKVHGAGGEEALEDEDVGRVLRQCLWQWGYELNATEYKRAMAGDG